MYMKKLIIILLSTIVLFGCALSLGACSSSDKTGATDQSAKTDKTEESVADTEWKTAYREILLDYQRTIEAYEYPEYGDPRPTTALCDINEDGVQELFFMADTDFCGSGELYVFSYRDGKAVELDVPYPEGKMLSVTEDGHFMYVNAASGTAYVIYKSAKNNFVICGTIADESSEKIICDCTVDEKLSISRDYWTEEMSLNWDDNDHYAGKTYGYYHKTDSIDQEEFDKQERRLADDMKQVILTNVEGDWDDPILTKASQQTSLAKFCADMIREMTVEESSADSSAGEGDYSQVLEEYKDAFALAKSGSDYDSEINSMKYVLESFMLGVSNHIMMGSDSADLHMQYAEIDLNGDGTKELIVGCRDDNYDETAIDSIFTVGKDEKVERILSCDSVMFRTAIAIYDDRTIEYSGSSGADANVYRFYKLKPDKTKLDLVVDLEQDGNSYTNNGEEMTENDFWDLVKEKEENNKMKLPWKEM